MATKHDICGDKYSGHYGERYNRRTFHGKGQQAQKGGEEKRADKKDNANDSSSLVKYTIKCAKPPISKYSRKKTKQATIEARYQDM